MRRCHLSILYVLIAIAAPAQAEDYSYIRTDGRPAVIRLVSMADSAASIEYWVEGQRLSEWQLKHPVFRFCCGDISGDGKVGVDDAQAALIAYTEQFAGNPVDLTAAQRKAVDVNEDGVLSVEDAQYILIFYTENNVAGKNVSWNEIIPKK